MAVGGEMTPTPADLVGVTVGGEPLQSVLRRNEEERKREEAEEEAEREVREKRRVILRHRPAGSMPEETSRVSKRVRHLTQDEIRKEYGIMRSPYASQIENVLWAIRENGPITPVDIAGMLGVKPIRIQGVCSLLWRTMKNSDPALLCREMKGGSYVYKTSNLQVTVEQMYSAYREAKVWKSIKKSAKDSPLLHPADLNPLDSLPTDKRIVGVIERAIEKELGVKVEITGRIEFVFKLG
jgi:hypothetical protein